MIANVCSGWNRRRWSLTNQDATDGSMQAIGKGAQNATAASAPTTTTKQAALGDEWVQRTQGGAYKQLDVESVRRRVQYEVGNERKKNPDAEDLQRLLATLDDRTEYRPA